MKSILTAFPFIVAALLSGCGSGCGTLGVANAPCVSGTSSATSTTASTSTFSISGTVSGTVLQGVAINLTGAETLNTTTVANGTYTFTALPTGSYTVVPSLQGSAFNPRKHCSNDQRRKCPRTPVRGNEQFCRNLQHFGHGIRRCRAERVDHPGRRQYWISADGLDRELQLLRPCGWELHGDTVTRRAHVQPRKQCRNADQQRKYQHHQFHGDAVTSSGHDPGGKKAVNASRAKV